MKIIKPYYYDKFKCIGGDCSYSCCQQWDINVDDKTLRKWTKLPVPPTAINCKGKLSDYVKNTEGWNQLVFNKKNRCPFLNSKELCDVVCTYGEENIPLTCHTFPRETHHFSNCTEMYLTPGCPAVLDLLWDGDVFSLIVETSDDDSTTKNISNNKLDGLFKLRKLFFDIASDDTLSIETALKSMFFIGSEIYHNNIGLKELKLNMKELSSEIDSLSCDFESSFLEKNELFLDVIEIYHENSKYMDFIEPLSAYANNVTLNSISFIEEKYNKFISNYNLTKYLRLLIQEEIMSALVTESTSSVEDVILKLQWITMEYSVIKHSLFLQFINDLTIDLNTIKQTVTYIYRIMGYTDSDIVEYFENSFEELIWPWGYYSLIL